MCKDAALVDRHLWTHMLTNADWPPAKANAEHSKHMVTLVIKGANGAHVM